LRNYFPTFIVIVFDQISKLWVINNFSAFESRDVLGTFVKFSYVKNPGIAFGISVGEFGIIITILSFFATLFIAYFHWEERYSHPLISIGLSLILGGAIGNFIDRSKIFFMTHYDGVVDFIDVGIGTFRWYTFNIADASVTIGIILYIYHSLFINKSNLADNID